MTPRRPLLLPLVPLYAAALAVRRLFPAAPRHLHYPVLSIGSLSAGGAGKTPFVQALAALLAAQGYAVDILSRGYGRASRRPARVDPQGDPRHSGDEPLLLARSTGLPVYVAPDRHAAGQLAEAAGQLASPAGQLAEAAVPPGRLHLLDDGFQHRRLARRLDIVLLTAADARDTLLPAGNLREPLAQLRRAHAIVLREEEAEQVGRLVPGTPVWTIRRTLALPPTAPRRRWLAFCGIARPESFFAMLRAHGLPLAATLAFPDHHPYRDPDLSRILDLAARSGATALLTTAKDAVKLPPALQARLTAPAPIAELAVAPLTTHLLDPEAILRQIAAAIGPPPPLAPQPSSPLRAPRA